MKKNLLLIIMLSFILLYSGCNKSNLKNEEIIENSIKEVNIATEVKENIKLPFRTFEGVKITWISSFPSILSSDGIVKLPNEKSEVVLTGIFSYRGCTVKKEYRVFVLSKEEVYTPLIKDAIDSILLPTTIDKNTVLPSNSGDISIIWRSKDIVIDNNIIMIDESRKYQLPITLTGKFSFNGISIEKDYYVLVDNDYDKLTKKIDEFEEVFRYDDKIEGLSPEFEGISLTWDYEPSGLVNEDGSFNHQEETKQVKLTIAFNLGKATIVKTYDLTIEKLDDDELISSAIAKVTIPKEVSDDLDLPKQLDNVMISWESSNPNYISNNGKVFVDDEEHEIELIATFKYKELERKVKYQVKVLKHTDEYYVKRAIQKINLPDRTKENVTLLKKIDNVEITWESKTISYISSEGEITRGAKDRTVKLEAVFRLNNYEEKVTYTIIILKYTDLEFINIVVSELSIPPQTNIDLSLPMYFDYDVVAIWTSSDENIITNDGKITQYDNDIEVTLSVIFQKGETKMEKEYKVVVLGKNELSTKKPHQVIVRGSEFNQDKMNGIIFEEGKISLSSTILEGTYESDEISTINFNGLVASWASTSSENATVELQLKVKVGDTWSNYISYYPWGFGLQNKCYDQNNGIISLKEDEVNVLNGKVGSAIIFKVTLKRTSIMAVSPKLSLVSFALKCNSYNYPVNISELPSEKIYDVPRLYQQIVPSIGNSICSPTTSTMLLKYKGEDFSSYDEFEHRYIAYKFKEYNTGIFGNWVYNTVGIGSFGYNAYVARMYSIEELVWHLANVGPVGLSVKGQMTSSEKDYYTNGHLIVGIGYKYINNVLYIVCNDPNVTNVYCEYSITVVNNTWRNIAYVVE